MGGPGIEEGMAPSPDDNPRGTLEAHEAEVVEAVAAFHRQHYESASGLQRLIDGVTGGLGRPVVFVALVLGVGAIAGLTLAAGGEPDGRAFAWLELGATLAALFVALAIMVSQRREDQLATRRSQLILELALLADRRGAKIVERLEALRRDAPDVEDRADEASDAMARPVDPEKAVAALEEKGTAR